MRKSTSRSRAGTLLAVLAATVLFPLYVLAGVPSRVASSHGCHCPVKMACCEAGLCHGDMDPAPSSGASWSGCRDEGSRQAAVPGPSTAFESALLPDSARGIDVGASKVTLETPARALAVSSAPALPPPRSSIALC